jgi:hypothetical protein
MTFSPYSHTLLDICRTNPLTEIDDELGYLLDVDDIFTLLGILLILNDLRTPGDLQGLLLLHPLSVCSDVP